MLSGRHALRSVSLPLGGLAFLLVLACSPPASEPPPPEAAAPLPADEEFQVVDSGAVAWSYAGDTGPASWSRLHPDFVLCAEGREQSPIDLPAPDATGENLPDPLFQYRSSPLVALRDSTGVRVVYEPGSSLRMGSGEWQLQQIQFHQPSEHTVDGQSFPLEMHLVHKDADGYLAVLAVFLGEGAENPAFAPILDHLPEKAGGEVRPSGVMFQAEDLLPAERLSWRYSGSLSVPPCSEGVQWIVLRMPVELGAAQLERLRAVLGDTHRPVQPLHDRTVQEDTAVDQDPDQG